MEPANATELITVRFPSILRAYCGGASKLVLSAPDVRSLLEQLELQYPSLYRNVCDETGKVRHHLNLFVNEDHVRELAGLDTRLAAGDVLTILPAVSGG